MSIEARERFKHQFQVVPNRARLIDLEWKALFHPNPT